MATTHTTQDARETGRSFLQEHPDGCIVYGVIHHDTVVALYRSQVNADRAAACRPTRDHVQRFNLTRV